MLALIHRPRLLNNLPLSACQAFICLGWKIERMIVTLFVPSLRRRHDTPRLHHAVCVRGCKAMVLVSMPAAAQRRGLEDCMLVRILQPSCRHLGPGMYSLVIFIIVIVIITGRYRYVQCIDLPCLDNARLPPSLPSSQYGAAEGTVSRFTSPRQRLTYLAGLPMPAARFIQLRRLLSF
nr:hypothetical protein CFP56_09605 [Quercus suber]